MAISMGGGGEEKPMSEINTTPLVDVMLVLLIIFMVTAPMITPSLIDLPSIGKANKQPDKVLQVVIQKDETLELVADGKTSKLMIGGVAEAVKNAQGADTNTAVVISADRNVKYENVVKVMDTLQRAGIARVGLSVQLAP